MEARVHEIPEGLADHDRAIIRHRLPVILSFLMRWLPATHPCHTAVAHGHIPPELDAWFEAFERTVTRADALEHDPPDGDAHRAGLRDWYDTYLIPLARDLDLVDQAQNTIIRTCWRQGLFDVLDTASGTLTRPPVEDILPPVQALLEEAAYTTSRRPADSRVAQLQRRGLCRDKACAEQVAEALRTDTIAHDAAGMARTLLISSVKHGPIGLLLHSACPYLNALIRLEHQKQFIDPAELPPGDVWASVRTDLIAFYRAAQRVHPKLWNERLLHEPANTSNRQHYQKKHLWHNQRTRFLAAIQQERGCSEDEATHLLDILAQQGLPALIDWRRGAEITRTRETWERRRLQKRLDHHLSVLADEDRQAIETTLQHLVAAMKETNVPLPLAMLIDDYPSSRRRKRLGRRFWFGLASILHRRESRRQRRQRQYWNRVAPHKNTTNQTSTNPDADRLVDAFARLADLDAGDVRTLLRDFITYGVLGLLPRAVRVRSVYEPLVSWLALIKWGRVPGSVPWLEVVRQVNRYGEQLGLPGSFSPQLARSIFNSIAKPDYWHGGQGDAVAQVRQRATVTADDIPRLHRAWLLAPVQMPLSVGDGHLQLWHGLLVFDHESQLPMGACFSQHPPGMREVQLALYDAIWHAGDFGWPLHGIPETIHIPQELAAEGLEDLEKAAAFLLMEIDTQRKKPWLGLKAVKKVLDDVRKRGGERVRQVIGERDDLQAGQITQVLLSWLKETSFPDHNPAHVPQSIRRHGVVMPGFDTPAAGWLLPVVGEVETVTNGVVHQGTRYSSPWFHSEPGQKRPYRAFPFFFPASDTGDAEGTQDALFVEVRCGSNTILYHLTRKG